MQTLLRYLAAGLLWLPLCEIHASEPLTLRVLSYNIHHAEGVDRVLDLERIAEVIRSVNPDVVALQEVDRQAQRSESVDQPARLAELTGLHVAFGANIPLQGGDYGNAILSRYPILKHRNQLLPNVDDGEQRGVLIAELQLPNRSQPLTLLATHLDHRSADTERVASAKLINTLAAEHPDRPMLLAGDLNDTPDSQTLRELKAQWTQTNSQPRLTIPVANPSRQIDFVLYRPVAQFTVVETQVLDEAVASDHRAILAVLKLQPPQPGSADSDTSQNTRIRQAADKALALLNTASAGSARQRDCFTCHSQAMPVLAMHAATTRGLPIDSENFAVQIQHTHQFLTRGRSRYEEGKGQGGGVDTAGYALWTLEDADTDSDETIQAVVRWLLTKQESDGHWRTTSNRPPSEASRFTTTYLALRALQVFGQDTEAQQVQAAQEAASRWLSTTEPTDTEDRVFRLLALTYLGTAADVQDAAVAELKTAQHENGGWSQLESHQPDAYATGTVLYALHQAGVATTDPCCQAGLDYLLTTQQADGSWFVKSRSNPFQTYYETGFPHGTDQFISTTATAWATLALLHALPEADPPAAGLETSD